MATYKTREQRIAAFMSRVRVDDNGCWIWQGEIRADGYGECWCFGKREMPHQAAFRELKCETLKSGEVLRHTCDVRKCCNPDHIISGTQADNIRDKVARNRQAKGEGHGMVKLTEDQVRLARTSPLSQRAMARQLNVTQQLIGMIRRRELWTHLD